MQNQKTPASQQVNQLNSALTQALVRKVDAEAAAQAADKEIVAIRNVLAGVGVGQELQKEIDVENRKLAAASAITNALAKAASTSPAQ